MRKIIQIKAFPNNRKLKKGIFKITESLNKYDKRKKVGVVKRPKHNLGLSS